VAPSVQEACRHLIAQPCAIKIRGQRKGWTSLCPDPHPRVHLPPTPRPQRPLGSSYRTTTIPGRLSTCPLVRPALTALVQRVADASLSPRNAKHPRPERGPCQASLKTLGNNLVGQTWLAVLASIVYNIQHIRTLAVPAGHELLVCSHLAYSHASLQHGCCYYYGFTIYENRHGR
jgi:hypothetical protein